MSECCFVISNPPSGDSVQTKRSQRVRPFSYEIESSSFSGVGHLMLEGAQPPPMLIPPSPADSKLDRPIHILLGKGVRGLGL